MRNILLLCIAFLFFTSCDVNPNGRKKVSKIRHINIKAFNNKFVCADSTASGSLIANRDEAKEWEDFTAYYFDSVTIALKSTSNKKYISSDGNSNNELIANRDTIGELEQFTIVRLENGQVALKAFASGFVSADQTLGFHFVANRPEIGVWEKFTITEVHPAK